MVYPFYGSVRECTIDTCYNIDESQNNYAQLKNQTKRVYTKRFLKCKLIPSDRNQMNGFWGLQYIWIGAEWKDYKRASGNGNDGYSHYVGHGYDFSGVHRCQSLSHSTF